MKDLQEPQEETQPQKQRDLEILRSSVGPTSCPAPPLLPLTWKALELEALLRWIWKIIERSHLNRCLLDWQTDSYAKLWSIEYRPFEALGAGTSWQLQRPSCLPSVSCLPCGAQFSYQLYSEDDNSKGTERRAWPRLSGSARCGLVLHCGHSPATNCVGQRFPLQIVPGHCALQGDVSTCQSCFCRTWPLGCIRHPHHTRGSQFSVWSRVACWLQYKAEAWTLVWEQHLEAVVHWPVFTDTRVLGGCHYRFPFLQSLHLVRLWEKTGKALLSFNVLKKCTSTEYLPKG